MEDLIKQIKDRLPIATLLNWLGQKVTTTGHVFSPVRVEKTPSTYIYFKDNRWHDFGTGEGGDVIDFYKFHYNLDAKTAIAELADRLGITPAKRDNNTSRRDTTIHAYTKERFIDHVKKALPDNLSERESEMFYERLGMACSFANDEILELNPEMEAVLNKLIGQSLKPVIAERLAINKLVFKEMYRYCTEKGFNEDAYKYLNVTRCLPDNLIKQFKIFTINNYNEVSNHMKKRFDVEDLHRSGLFNKKFDEAKNEWKYNLIFYNHRIIIPYTFRKEIVYLRGRYFDQQNNHESNGAKYLGLKNDALNLNSPKRFFNTDALLTMMPGERLYIVEGEFDCMVVEAVFKKNCIAVPGVGNLKDERLEALKNYDVCICVDNDPAGNELYERIKQKFLSIGKAFSIKVLPVKDANALLMEI